MRDRSTLHPTHLPDFTEYAKKLGWERKDTVGAYEVLRLKRNGFTLIFYKRDRTDHVTVHGAKALAMVRAFILERKDRENKDV